MAINCSSVVIPDAANFLRELEPVYFGLTITCAILALAIVLIYLEEYFYMYMNLDTWKSRVHVIFLLSVYPVHAILSMVSMFVPRSIPINDMATAVYISIALYVFVRLLISHYGGKERMMQLLIGNDMKLRTTPVCCCFWFLPTVKVSRAKVHILEVCVLQYGIFRTFSGYASAVGYVNTLDTFDMSAIFSRGFLLITSTLVAMYALQLLYEVSIVPLRHIPLTPKFRTLQLILVIDNMQSALFNFLATLEVMPCARGLTRDMNAYRIHRMISVLEILILSLVARKYYKEHMEAIRNNTLPSGLSTHGSEANVQDIMPPEESQEQNGSDSHNEPSKANAMCEDEDEGSAGFTLEIPDNVITSQKDILVNSEVGPANGHIGSAGQP